MAEGPGDDVALPFQIAVTAFEVADGRCDITGKAGFLGNANAAF